MANSIFLNLKLKKKDNVVIIKKRKTFLYRLLQAKKRAATTAIAIIGRKVNIESAIKK